MFMQFSLAETKRMFSTELVERLNAYSGRPWKDLLRGKPIGEKASGRSRRQTPAAHGCPEP